MFVGVLALNSADLLVDAVACISHNLRFVLDYLPSVVLCLLINILDIVDQKLIMSTLGVVQLFYSSIGDRVQVVGADYLTVAWIIADSARKALVKITTWVGQVRIHHLEPGHVNVVLFLLGRVQLKLDFKTHVTSQLLNG